MKKQSTLALLLLLIIQISCNKNEKAQQFSKSDFRLVIEESKGKVMENADEFNSLLDTVVYVPMESTPQSLIGKIDRLEVVNDTLVLFDEKNETILTFTKQGKFVGKLGTKGKGPNEYTGIDCFAIDRERNHILLVDDSRKNIFRYT